VKKRLYRATFDCFKKFIKITNFSINLNPKKLPVSYYQPEELKYKRGKKLCLTRDSNIKFQIRIASNFKIILEIPNRKKICGQMKIRLNSRFIIFFSVEWSFFKFFLSNFDIKNQRTFRWNNLSFKLQMVFSLTVIFGQMTFGKIALGQMMFQSNCLWVKWCSAKWGSSNWLLVKWRSNDFQMNRLSSQSNS
jgi:hypothetical protein